MAAGQCYDFWKREVKDRIADGPADLGNYPCEYCYFASEWSDGGSPIVLLSKAH
jgi:hypothetical protein